MSAQAVPAEAGPESSFTANERLKRSFGSRFWGSMIVATVAHFAVFQLWRPMSYEDFSYSSDELTAIELPPEIEILPPPEQIARPATPVIATADIDEDITIAPTTFEDNPVEDLSPPPAEVTTTDISAPGSFTPYTVKPDIIQFTPALNRDKRVPVWISLAIKFEIR